MLIHSVCVSACLCEGLRQTSKTGSARTSPDSLRQALFIESGADSGGLLGSLLSASPGITSEPIHLPSAYVDSWDLNSID